MATEIRVPTLGESVTEATIARWMKKEGDAVSADEPLVELETDKVSVEVPAPSAGAIAEIIAKEGDTVAPDALLAMFEAGEGAAAAPAAHRPVGPDPAFGGAGGASHARSTRPLAPRRPQARPRAAKWRFRGGSTWRGDRRRRPRPHSVRENRGGLGRWP